MMSLSFIDSVSVANTPRLLVAVGALSVYLRRRVVNNNSSATLLFVVFFAKTDNKSTEVSVAKIRVTSNHS